MLAGSLLNVRIQNFKETIGLNYIYNNELDTSSFIFDSVYADNKDLANRTVSDKMLNDRD